mmetsp:Transcript_90739/g.270840  ORF Transcript_90739/g.270840 Transcript_90739/m.270840 type:complete len:385 (-) Transcript_90739:153-1307(-)
MLRTALHVDVRVQVEQLLDGVGVVPHHRLVDRSVAAEGRHVEVRLELLENFQHLRLAVDDCHMHRGCTALALEVEIRLGFQQRADGSDLARAARVVQGRVPAVVGEVQVCSVGKEEIHGLFRCVRRPGSKVQSVETGVVHTAYVGIRVQQLAHCLDVALLRGAEEGCAAEGHHEKMLVLVEQRPWEADGLLEGIDVDTSANQGLDRVEVVALSGLEESHLVGDLLPVHQREALVDEAHDRQEVDLAEVELQGLAELGLEVNHPHEDVRASLRRLGLRLDRQLVVEAKLDELPEVVAQIRHLHVQDLDLIGTEEDLLGPDACLAHPADGVREGHCDRPLHVISLGHRLGSYCLSRHADLDAEHAHGVVGNVERLIRRPLHPGGRL